MADVNERRCTCLGRRYCHYICRCECSVVRGEMTVSKAAWGEGKHLELGCLHNAPPLSQKGRKRNLHKTYHTEASKQPVHRPDESINETFRLTRLHALHTLPNPSSSSQVLPALANHPISKKNSNTFPLFVASTLATSLTCFLLSFPSCFIASRMTASLIHRYALGCSRCLLQSSRSSGRRS